MALVLVDCISTVSVEYVECVSGVCGNLAVSVDHASGQDIMHKVLAQLRLILGQSRSRSRSRSCHSISKTACPLKILFDSLDTP